MEQGAKGVNAGALSFHIKVALLPQTIECAKCYYISFQELTTENIHSVELPDFDDNFSMFRREKLLQHTISHFQFLKIS